MSNASDNRIPKKRKRRGRKTGIAICLVAALAVGGTYSLSKYRNHVQQQFAKAEEENKALLEQAKNDMAAEEETDTSSARSSGEGNNLVIRTDEVGNTTNSYVEQGDTEKEHGSASEETDSASAQAGQNGASAVSGTSNQVNFSATDKLLWPIEGAILMNYSMDQTIYFSTLDQYRYNPALIISGAVNDQVLAAGKGIVKSVNKGVQTGNQVTIDMGNGYEAIYGQLQNVLVKTGDYVETKTVLGYLAEPTKYYSVEGCNLYFELRKDGQPIDPMDYLEQ